MIRHLKNTLRNKALRFVGLLSVMVMFFGVISNTSYAQQTTPPANTTIGNQATATYEDNGGNQRTVTSNTVETVVQQVAGVTISQGVSKTVSPGGTVTFSHTITNTGNGTDSFNLTEVDANTGNYDFTNINIYADADGNGVPDNNTDITSTPNIDAGDTYGIVISANMPASAVDGDQEEINITAESVFDNDNGNTPAASDNATNTATVEEDAVINVQKSVDKSSASPNEQVTFTLTFSNNGNSEGTNLVIKDPLPEDLTYVAGSGLWSGSGTNLDDNAGGDPTGIEYEFQTSGSDPDSVYAKISSLPAGASGTLKFSATINSGTEGETITNFAEYQHDDLDNFVETNNATITIDETYGITIVGNETVSKSSVNQGATVNFVNEYTNTGSTSDTYNITLENSNYPSGTTFTLYKTDGSGNPTSPYTDTNGDGTPDTGPIGSGDNVKVILQASLPSDANGSGPFTADVKLTSVNDPTATPANDKHIDELAGITAAVVDITNDDPSGTTPAPPGDGDGPNGTAVQTMSTDPGTQVSFNLHIKNESSIDDSYSLNFGKAVSGGDLTNPGSLPTGWSVQFRDPNNGNSVITSTGTLTPGSSKEVNAIVSIPAGASPEQAKSIYFRAYSSTTGAKDVIHDAVTINTKRSVSLAANNNGQIFPGGSKLYEHTLSINSNVVENTGTHADSSDFSVKVTNTNSGSFTSVVYWDTDGDGQITPGTDQLLTTGSGGIVDLPSGVGAKEFGDKIRFIVKVSSSTGASDGATNTTTLEVSDSNGPIATMTNEDITTVVAGLLTVEKFQAPDNNGSPGTYTKTQFNVNPGDKIHYKITVTNDGAASVSDVVITDNTPSYTTLEGGVSTSGDISSPTINKPNDEQAGTITVDAGGLAPGESFDITFVVQVDETGGGS